MSYALTHSYDGHEITYIADSLDAINAHIRSLYDEHGNVTILRVEEDHDGPRTWAIEYPPAPPAGTRVRTVSGTELTVGENGTIEFRGVRRAWKSVVKEFGPLTEVVETEVEAAARRLREAGYDTARLATINHGDSDDIAVVLYHVLNGGQL